MYKNLVVVLFGVVALLAAPSAEAGFTSINLDSLDGELIGVATNIGEDGNADVGFGEKWEEGQEAFNVSVSGEVNSDPVMTITKVVENQTGMVWPGYRIDLLNPAGATFQGTPVSSDFTFNAGASTSTSLIFGGPGSLPSGQAVTFAFDINVPTTSGPFGFTIAQQVIPEPATLLMGLLMAGAGAAVTLQYRWG